MATVTPLVLQRRERIEVPERDSLPSYLKPTEPKPFTYRHSVYIDRDCDGSGRPLYELSDATECNVRDEVAAALSRGLSDDELLDYVLSRFDTGDDFERDLIGELVDSLVECAGVEK